MQVVCNRAKSSSPKFQSSPLSTRHSYHGMSWDALLSPEGCGKQEGAGRAQFLEQGPLGSIGNEEGGGWLSPQEPHSPKRSSKFQGDPPDSLFFAAKYLCNPVDLWGMGAARTGSCSAQIQTTSTFSHFLLLLYVSIVPTEQGGSLGSSELQGSSCVSPTPQPPTQLCVWFLTEASAAPGNWATPWEAAV